MSVVHIVFDIDGVLALIDRARSFVYSKETTTFFSNHASILQVSRSDGPPDIYYLVPGVLELMQLLFSRTDVLVSFFSAGSDGRNSEFVKQLLTKALGSEHYKRIAPNLMILNRTHVTSLEVIDFQVLQNQLDRYGLHSMASYKKDLTKTLRQGCSLENTIFIEDNPDVVYSGQERNLLFCSDARPEYYAFLSKGDTVTYSSYFRFFCACFVGIQCASAEDELFRRVNSIYYTTGLLMECIEKNKAGTMLEDLFRLQFEASSCEDRFVPRFRAAHKTQHYYDQGLSHLQKINPNLSFNTPSYYLSHTQVTLEKPTLHQENNMHRSLLKEIHLL